MRASHDALIELFERIESFFKRLWVYTQVSLTTEMAEVFVKIVAEVLSILSIATHEVKRKFASEFIHDILYTRSFSSLVRNLFQETVGSERYRGCVQKIRSPDTRGGADGHSSDSEGDY